MMSMEFTTFQKPTLTNALTSFLFQGRRTPIYAEGWKLEQLRDNGELRIDDKVRFVEYTFDLVKSQQELILINTHRLSRYPREGNGTSSLKELECSIASVGEIYDIGLKIQFLIKYQWWKRENSTQKWVINNGYAPLRDDGTLYEKVLREFKP